MVKTVFAEEQLLNVLTTISEKTGYTPGLIIGQPSEKKDFVLHLIPTPKLKDESPTSDNCYKELEHIEDSSLKVQMKHVTRSLPGGIYVIGIFIVGPKDIFNDKLGIQKVRSLVTNLYSSTKSNVYLYGNNCSSNRLVLHYCPKSKRYQCKSFDVKNMNMSMNPVTWKFVERPVSWYRIDCHYMMDSLLPYLIFSEKKPPLKSLFKDILAAYKTNIDKCECMISGYFEGNSDCNTLEDIRSLLIKQMGFENEVKKDEIEEYDYLKIFQATLFEKENPDDNQQNETLNIKGKVLFSGVVASRIFIHRSATIGEAVNAVKEDIVRSLAARIELHCDSLEEDSPGDEEVVHVPPRRVVANHPSSGIMFSDYIFPDDTMEDIAESLNENLGIEVLPESICDLEPPGEKSEENSDGMEEEKLNKVSKKENSQFNILMFGLIGAVIVLLLSIAAHFLL